MVSFRDLSIEALSDDVLPGQGQIFDRFADPLAAPAQAKTEWSTGTFAFTRTVDAITDETAPLPLQSALLEAARQVDEATRSAPLDMRRCFVVDRDAVQAAGDLDKVEEAVLDLAAAGLTVRRMIDVIPDSDGAVHEAIRALLERGALRPKN